MCYIEREQNKKFKCSVVVLRVKRTIVKLTKRLVALLLALMLVVGLLAVTASAISNYCYLCKRAYPVKTTKTSIAAVRVENCGNYSSTHTHNNFKIYESATCPTHGVIDYATTYQYGVCPYA